MSSEPPPSLFGLPVRRIHCLGVGGTGTAPLAIYLSQLGYTVSGEDDALSEEVASLLGREGVALGPLPEAAALVVHSSAIRPEHPSRRAAEARGLRQVRRGEMLAEASRGLKLVAVCGSHGKTTTTAMIITALEKARFPAGYLLGGLFKDGAPPARKGANEWLVAEIDESDGTIESFQPEITVAVNLDWDHPDHYRTQAEILAAFRALFRRTRSAVLASESCPHSRELAAAGGGPVFYTFGSSGDFRAAVTEESGDSMVLRLEGRFPAARASVRARGAFNAANAAAALAAVQLMGAPFGAESLADYRGVRRRQGILRAEGPVVVEDYAHHPAEIRALLPSLRRLLKPKGRLIAVFQPHRYSRTAQFKADFAEALALADRVLLLDVYPAGEAPVPGGASADLFEELKRRAGAIEVEHLPGAGEGLFDRLDRSAGPGDVVAFVGAGDIDRKARAWTGRLAAAGRSARRWDDVAQALKARISAASRVRREEPLARRTTMGVGGAARVYVEPASVEDLKAAALAAREASVPMLLLGRGSNLIVPDEGVDGIVVSLSSEAWSGFEPLPDGRVRVGAGLRLKQLCGLAAQAGLSGFEFLEGIPGTVGGALRMNAGAMGGWMFDLVEEVDVMTPEGEVRTLKPAEMNVDYRRCGVLEHAVALGAVLRRRAGEPGEDIARQIDVYRRRRHETQPREPSAGCVFKNPPGQSAGRLIDQSGLKGERVGDAEVSTVHANFIVNRGEATASDVLELVRRVRARVRERTGVSLEPEVLLYGKPWKDVL